MADAEKLDVPFRQFTLTVKVDDERTRLRVAGDALATALRTGRGTDAALDAWEALRT